MTIPPPDPALVARFRADVIALTGGTPGRLGVAVSGGADSLALLLLAAAAFASPWLPRDHQRLSLAVDGDDGGRHGPPPAQERRALHAISVDHGLRPEAAAECRFVGEVCGRLGVPHETVPVAVRETGDGLQAAARVARRGAYRRWAERHDGMDVLTGHHADDQAETVLMRLARGAGVGGLSGIPSRSQLTGVPEPPRFLLRPLLSWTRAELRGIVAASGLIPVIDPSNADRRFDRTRFRALLASTDLLRPQRLAAAANHIRDADEAVAWSVAALRERHLVGNDGAERVLLILADWPREILRRLVLEAFAAMAAYPDGPGTIRLIAALEAGRAATLAGIKVVPRDGTWTFTKAPPRRSH